MIPFKLRSDLSVFYLTTSFNLFVLTDVGLGLGTRVFKNDSLWQVIVEGLALKLSFYVLRSIGKVP